jgi:hypothetical protein
MNITKKGDIHEVTFEYSGENWNQWVLLMTDEHYDSALCDRSLLRRHHEEAKAKNAPIFKFGDIFDCMGGKYDPRTHKGDIRPEHNVKDYFDAIVRDAANFYGKYDVAFISPGNHEENVLNRHETDLIGNLARAIGAERGDYSGYIRFSFVAKSGGRKRHADMYYDHGMGGNSPVTKGVISTNRRGVNYDADIFISGHNHNRWTVEVIREYVNKVGAIKSKQQLHINSGTYQDKPSAGRDRFASGFGQPNKGGVWLNFHFDGTEDRNLCIKAVNA